MSVQCSAAQWSVDERQRGEASRDSKGPLTTLLLCVGLVSGRFKLPSVAVPAQQYSSTVRLPAYLPLTTPTTTLCFTFHSTFDDRLFNLRAPFPLPSPPVPLYYHSPTLPLSPMSASTEPPYAVGDVILVEQGNRLHDAKVLELGDGSVDGHDVYVHYPGWNAKWDSWARLEHTRRITGESREEQARMAEELDTKAKEAKKKQRGREAAGIGTAATHSIRPQLSRASTIHRSLSHSMLAALAAFTVLLHRPAIQA